MCACVHVCVDIYVARGELYILSVQWQGYVVVCACACVLYSVCVLCVCIIYTHAI